MEAVKAKIESLKQRVADKEDQVSELEEKLREERNSAQKVFYFYLNCIWIDKKKF